MRFGAELRSRWRSWLALATLIHALVTCIRRRATDLAILKTLGLVRRQVVATVFWQATTLMVLSLVVG